MSLIKTYAQNFIGKKIIIIKNLNKKNKVINGTIIDETKNTFTIETEKKDVKKVLKNQIFFTLDNDNEKIIDGSKIIKRPEERLKLKV